MANHNSSSGTFTTKNGNAFIINNPLFNQKKNSLQQSASQLIFNKAPFDLEGEVCGTESMLFAAQCWHEIADSSDNLQVFLTDDIYKMCSDIQDSINQTDQVLAASLSCNITANEQARILEAFEKFVQHQIDVQLLKEANISSQSTMNFIRAFSLRQHFMSVYHIDEETMAQVEEWIEKYENGDPEVVTIIKKYQNKSAEEWKKILTDESKEEERKEFTALAALFIICGDQVEQNSNDKTSREIFELMISNLYSVKNRNEDDFFSDATLDVPFVTYLKVAMGSLGASDSVSYNIATKILGDDNSYRVYNQGGDKADVHAYIYYEENGFVGVHIQDCQLTNAESAYQFIATGKEHAKEFIGDLREENPGYSNHGMTDDELSGMFQSVKTANDMNIMKNIIISDSDFKINGDNAFDIEYMEDRGGNWDYENGISSTFSVSLGQMNTILLKRGKKENFNTYESFIEAISDSSINSAGTNHNIMRDIATGAGVYVDSCAIAVLEDEEGGDNDAELKEELDAANAGYGAMSELYGRFKEDELFYQGGATYSDVDISNITYSEGDDGQIHLKFDMSYDKETGFLFWREKNGVNDSFDIYLGEGDIALKEQQEGIQQDLKSEMERKKAELVVDTVIDLAGGVNPLLKDGLNIAKDVSTAGNIPLHSATLVKDEMKDIFKGDKYKHLHTGTSFGTTMLGAFSKYDDIVREYEKAKEQSNSVQKLNSFYSYNSGSKTVGLYNYDIIREVQKWDKNGVVEIVGGDEGTNDRIYNELVTDGAINNSVLQTIAVDVTDEEHTFDYLLKDGDDSAAAKNAYTEIAEKTGYTQENIEEALKVMIYGQNDENATYRCITDIPFELQDACMHAISKHGTDSDIYAAWGGNN